jgi:hypothetical protein
VSEHILILPEGHKFIMIVIAVLKRTLVDVKMTAGEALHFFEQINDCIDWTLTEEMVQAIEPASNTMLAMIDTARELDPPDRKPDDPLPPSVYMLSKAFDAFVQVNAGIAAAIELMRERDRRLYATVALQT